MNDGKLIHSTAIVDNPSNIGPKTRVWAFAHILGNAKIGSECNICDGVFIENDVVIGDRVTIKCGVQLWDGLCLEDDVHIGPNVTFTNDKYPRSKKYSNEWPKTIIHSGASIGANATILPGIKVGLGAMVGAGSVVTKDVPNHALVVGNPALFKSWICRCGNKLEAWDGIFAKCECGKCFQMMAQNRILEIQK